MWPLRARHLAGLAGLVVRGPLAQRWTPPVSSWRPAAFSLSISLPPSPSPSPSQVFYTWVARSRSGSSSFTASALNKLSSSSSSSSSLSLSLPLSLEAGRIPPGHCFYLTYYLVSHFSLFIVSQNSQPSLSPRPLHPGRTSLIFPTVCTALTEAAQLAVGSFHLIITVKRDLINSQKRPDDSQKRPQLAVGSFDLKW